MFSVPICPSSHESVSASTDSTFPMHLIAVHFHLTCKMKMILRTIYYHTNSTTCTHNYIIHSQLYQAYGLLLLYTDLPGHWIPQICLGYNCYKCTKSLYVLIQYCLQLTFCQVTGQLRARSIVYQISLWSVVLPLEARLGSHIYPDESMSNNSFIRTWPVLVILNYIA